MAEADASRVEELFQRAADLPPAQRDPLLDAECAGQPRLRAAVERLLRALDDSERFLETPVAGLALASPSRPTAIGSAATLCEAPDPVRIGDYEVEGVLGTGGHGRVYAAVQDTPHRRVAIKVLRAGAMSPAAQARFGLEIELLGRLNHPGICKIFDAGEASIEYGDGSRSQAAFCAMELVEGLPLTRFCAERRLGQRDRITLVATIADAVHHAHTRGVVHRDLKPQNVLVTVGESPTSNTDSPPLPGQPKILDFGVARLTDGTEHSGAGMTLPGVMLGTLGYMSPEQFGEGEVDARSDVWALGVIAWELLAGDLPIPVAGRSLLDAAQAVREHQPGRLTFDGRPVDADLDTVVRRALAKDPDRRYGSAAELAADLRRWLGHEPITARKPGFFHQLRLLARRHRAIATGTALAAVGLVAATAISTTFYLAADRALHQAVDAQDTAREVARFLQEDLLREAHPSRTLGSEPTVRDLLERASERIDGRFPDRPAVEAGIRTAMARAWSGLGDGKAAVEHATRAVELSEPLGGEPLIEALTALGEAMHIAGDEQGSLTVRERATRLARTELPPDDARRYHTAIEYADQLTMQGRYAEAIELLGDLSSAAERHLGSDHPATLKARNNLGLALTDVGRLDEAIRIFRDVVAIRHRTIGDRHPSILITESNLALALQYAGELEEARDINESVLARRREVLGADHRATLLSLNNLSLTQRALGDLEPAIATATEALELTRRTRGEDHRDTIRLECNLASYLLDAGRRTAALPLLERSLAGAERAYPEGHWVVGWHHLKLADGLAATGSLERARTELETAYAILVAALGADHRRIKTVVDSGLRLAERLDDDSLRELWQARRSAVWRASEQAGR
ncbi:MAG TPA: serine/threonine protein kinase [bacterium]|nr:serine/threonine protein kinase [bacterium]